MAKIRTCILATKQFQPTRLVENESFQKNDSVICEFEIFSLSLHPETIKAAWK